MKTNIDQAALDVATKIMGIAYGKVPPGGPMQIKALIQCAIIETIEQAAPPADAQPVAYMDPVSGQCWPARAGVIQPEGVKPLYAHQSPTTAPVGIVVRYNEGGSGEREEIESIGRPGYALAAILPVGTKIYTSAPTTAPASESIDSRQFVDLLNAYAHAPFGQDDAPYQAILAAINAHTASQVAASKAPVAVPKHPPKAWMRKWAFDGEKPEKVKLENGRLAWPSKFKFKPVTECKIFPDDVPLSFVVEIVLPEWPDMVSLADYAYAQETPEEWDEDYRRIWQSLQIQSRNLTIMRAYARQLRELISPAMTNASEGGEHG